MIKLKKDYPYSHDGIRLVEYKEGQETSELPDEVEAILIERGDACECKKEEKVEPKIENKEEKMIDPKELPSYKEPEENKMVKVEENKVNKKTKKAKKK